MNLITKRKIIYIDSGLQLTSTNNVFVANLDVEIPAEYNYVSLVGFQCPVSYYIIASGNNTFQLREGSTTVSISVLPGNYNILSFQSTISALLTANSPNGYTYTITYPTSYTTVDTGKFTYQVNSTATTVSLLFPSNNAIADTFGFPNGATATFTPSGLVQTLISQNVVSFVPESSLFLHMSTVDGECQSEYSDVLQVIYSSNAMPYSVISWTNPQILETSKKLRGNVGRVLQFSITDEYGAPLYLQGQNCLLTLLFFSYTPPTPEGDSLLTKYIYMRTNILENEDKKAIEAQDREEQSLFLQRELIEQNKRIISLLEQLNNTVNKDNATSKNAIEGGESPFDILETQQ
jgi:hypothetical protein